MSLFRKPKKPIQRRVFTAAEDEDEDVAAGSPVAPPPPRIREKPRKEKEKPPTQTLLSFADEEGDGEVFRVKKSSQSKRLARAREKERRRTDTEQPHFTNSRDLTHSTQVEDQESEEAENAVEKRADNGAAAARDRMEGLVLAGREALAAGAEGDLEDDQETEHDEAGFHTYRAESVRAALTRGTIPDAALIHAARKTRAQARETGRDYIPISTSGGAGSVGGSGGGGAGSRLVRDDGSGSDEDEGRVAVQGVIHNKPHDARGSGSGGDSEGEAWERQQLLKAVCPLVVPVPESVDMQLNLFAVAPPAPSLAEAPPHLRPLQIAGERTPAALHTALRDRLETLMQTRAVVSSEVEDIRTRLLIASRTRDAAAARAPALDRVYRRTQTTRSYFTDLIECLDEKIPALEALEARALAMHRRRCEFLAERRRADTRDQAQDVMSAGAGRAIARGAADEAKQRRCAEREGRRRARRLAREAAAGALASNHRDGDSSDDELPPSEMHHLHAEREALLSLSGELFADALPAWRSVRGVSARVSRLRRDAPAAYADAYVAECLPRILAPYVRAELVLWNPLADRDNDDFEKMDWYRCLLMYGVEGSRYANGAGDDSEDEDDDMDEDPPAAVTERSVRDDPDLMLLPTIVARVLLPKITELVESAWDPMCIRATTRLRGVLLRAAALPPRDLPPRRRLAAEVRARLQATLATDVFLPALPPQIMSGAGGVFWRRCLGAGVRLLRAVLSLCPPPEILAADPVALRLIGTLCTAAGAAPPVYSAAAASALASTLPRSPAPLRRAALARIATLAAAAVSRLDSDNPLHLKALEQARGVVAEARGEGIDLTRT